MNSYSALSAYYDRFTIDVGYEKYADFIENVFRKEGTAPKLVLDLACGTGNLTKLLALRGYEMIGADASTEMLMQAMDNTINCEPRPLFLNQRMEELDLYGTVDACICCLDSVNYVTDPKLLKRAFEKVHLFLEPKTGLFLFDVNTPEKFHKIDGNSYVREEEDVFCVWQAALEDNMCAYQFDIFERKGDMWVRKQENHEERVYSLDVIKSMLEQAGFSDIMTYGGQDFSEVKGGEDRVYFTARRKD